MQQHSSVTAALLFGDLGRERRLAYFDGVLHHRKMDVSASLILMLWSCRVRVTMCRQIRDDNLLRLLVEGVIDSKGSGPGRACSRRS